MEDHRSIPEFAPPRRAQVTSTQSSTPVVAHSTAAAASKRQAARRFRKGDAIAEIRERNIREFHLIEWSLVLNGQVVTTRQFGMDDRATYEHEIHGVTSDLAGSGWREDRSSAA